MDSVEKIKYFYETIISENQIGKVAEFVHEKCYVKVGERPIPAGVGGVKEHTQATKQTYPDYKMKIIKQFCGGDCVISESVMESTHKGEWLGTKPTNKRLVFTDINVNKVVDERIVEHGGAVNTFEILFEAGMIETI